MLKYAHLGGFRCKGREIFGIARKVSQIARIRPIRTRHASARRLGVSCYERTAYPNRPNVWASLSTLRP